MRKVLFFLALLFVIKANAQTTASCEVLVDSIKGTYTGECDKGKAHGEGKSVGINTYEGSFKKGYPEGKGTYTWTATGSFYTGSWKKGLQDGYGEMHVKSPGKGESLVKGYWSKGKYKGEYENPYKIFNNSTEIGRVQFSKVRESTNGMGSISIQIQDIASNTPITAAYSSGTILKMTSAQITGGTYMSKATSSLTNREITTLQGATFPLRGIFTFGTISIDFEIYEAGDWTVEIPVRK